MMGSSLRDAKDNQQRASFLDWKVVPQPKFGFQPATSGASRVLSQRIARQSTTADTSFQRDRRSVAFTEGIFQRRAYQSPKQLQPITPEPTGVASRASRKISLARDQDFIMEAMYGTQQRREAKRMYRRRDNQ